MQVVVGLEVLDREPRVVDPPLEHEVGAQVVAARSSGGRPSKCWSSGTTRHECGMFRVTNVWPQTGHRHMHVILTRGCK